MSILYVALVLEQFSFEMPLIPKLPVEVDAGHIVAYLPVYNSLEALREEYPDAAVARIVKALD